MEQWFEKAVVNPWPFIALALLWAAFKGSKWIGQKLLDDEKGIITTFLDNIRTDSQELKKVVALQGESIAQSSKSLAATQGAFQSTILAALANHGESIAALERQLINAIQAKPEDDELFHVLFTNNPVPICYVGPDNGFTTVNRALEDLLGYSAGELSLLKFPEITLESDIPGDLENVARVKAGSLDRYRMSKTYRHKDGHHVPANLYVFRYPAAGAFLHYISIIIPKGRSD